MQCPRTYTPQAWTCNVSRCCSNAECIVNVQGPCVCATYGDPSPTQPSGWNYSFIATCSQNSVTGTVLGTQCKTLLGAPYAYSCYCRPRTTSDTGAIGDKADGNAIFDVNDNCAVFKSVGSGSSGSGESGSSSTKGSAGVVSVPQNLVLSALFLLTFIF